MRNTEKMPRDMGRLAEQKIYEKQVKFLLDSRYVSQPLACVKTYGCQQNVSDSEHIKGMLEAMGFGFTEDPSAADFILYNTCAVRGHAEDRVYGNVGALKAYKRRRPGLTIALCGCMMQQPHVAERIRTSYPYVDLVFGTHVLHRLPEFLYHRYTGAGRIFELPESDGEIIEGLPVRRDGTLKSWLPVMYGCNNFCTYCVVPYVRGRERSRLPEDILAEAKELIAGGCREITLLGQNVNSYGLGESHGVNFAGLLREIDRLPGEFRIRFMTSHPKDCTIELLDAMRDCEKVSRHLHLPFQSGSDRILKRMNRRYTKSDYLRLVEAAKERLPGISLTSDIIVGFPGETYEDFKETLSVVRQVEFTSLFTFIYSPREGTPAASMEDPVSREEKGRWFEELLKTQEAISEANTRAMKEKVCRVLCEEEGRAGEGTLTGRTDGNMTIEFPGEKSLIGSFAAVRVTGTDTVLQGELVES